MNQVLSRSSARDEINRRSAMVPAIREPVLNRSFCLRLAMIGAAACLLAACGRKGALDPPPGGMMLEPRPGTMAPVTPRAGAPVQAPYDEEGKPIAPPGTKRHIPLDWLID
jgi:predicted small lipoprotein YifL